MAMLRSSHHRDLPSPWYETVGIAENLRRNPIDPDVVIGIRAALRASSMDALCSVVSRVAVQVGMGVVLGALGAMMISPNVDVVVARRLATVTPVIALIMVVVGVVAAYGPARPQPAHSAGGSGEGGVTARA